MRQAASIDRRCSLAFVQSRGLHKALLACTCAAVSAGNPKSRQRALRLALNSGGTAQEGGRLASTLKSMEERTENRAKDFSGGSPHSALLDAIRRGCSLHPAL